MKDFKKGRGKTIGGDIKYEGRVVSLRVDKVKFESGAVKPREVVLHKDAVAVLPETNDGKIILVKQYRHAVDEELFEIPAGLIEDGEDPKDAAARELREETGYRPGALFEVAEFYTSPGFCTEKIYLYFASELTEAKLPEDDDEYIKVCGFSRGEIQKMLSEKKIKDGKTISAFYWYEARGKR